jgi:hypothetical protein
VVWYLIGLALVLVCLVVLAVVLWGVWRRVQALGAEVTRANEAVEQAGAGLTQLQSAAQLRHAAEAPAAGRSRA